MKLRTYQIIATIGTVLVGSFLHFAYELSGNYQPLALISAVNESTWEHLKIGFWPALIFVIIGTFLYRKNYENYFIGAVKTLYLIPIIIIAGFYGYTALIPDNFILDISLFVVAIVIAEYIGYKITVSNKDYSSLKIFAIIFILIEIACFSLFTYVPLQNILFRDPVFGGYGIQKGSCDISGTDGC